MPPAPYDRWFGTDTFDATYGYDEAALLDVGAPAEPPGFAEFWQGLYAHAMSVDPAPAITPSATPPAVRGNRPLDVDLHDLTFTSLDGLRLGGWVALPHDGVVDQAVVVSHGYGGRAEPDLTLVPERAAAIFPVARGLPSRSLLRGVPQVGVEHVLHGIESVQTYIHRGCVADMWCAATALLHILPEPPARLGYVGGSFGGGIGALALPWDQRFTAATLHVPSFGNHPLRLTLPCTGSGESIRRYVQKHPKVREVLQFFDAATAARRIRIPTLLGPARWDPAVPPPGQFAICSAVAGTKEWFVFSAGHADYPGDADEFARFAKLAHAFLRR